MPKSSKYDVDQAKLQEAVGRSIAEYREVMDEAEERERERNEREYGKLPPPPAASHPLAPSNPVAAVKTEETTALRASIGALSGELPEAKARAEALASQVARSEQLWAAATSHTLAEAESLQMLREETAATRARVVEIETCLAELQPLLETRRKTEDTTQRQQLVAEMWKPFVEQHMAPVARTLLALLTEQAQLHDRLVREGAWRFVGMDGLSVRGARGEELLSWALERWLHETEKAGYVVAEHGQGA